MTRYSLLFLLLLVAPLTGSARVTAFFNYCNYFSPERGPYIETYLSVEGNSINYIPVDKGFMGEVLITLVIKNSAGEIKYADKYAIASPVVPDSTTPIQDFIDLQRIPIASATYIFELEIRDKNDTANFAKFEQEIFVDPIKTSLRFSDIMPVESSNPSTTPTIFSKNNYELIPFVSTFYSGKVKDLGFYFEIYDADKTLEKDGKYLISYFIENSENGSRINGFSSFQKETPKSITPVLKNFSILNLPSGNYNLVVEARDKENILLTEKRLFFQRSNPELQNKIENFENLELSGSFVEYYKPDSVREFIRSLRPICREAEKNYLDNQVKANDSTMMKKFFLAFWTGRSPADPAMEWSLYKEQVDKVEKAYGSKFRKGYDTDRGRIYLKYGSPNTVSPAYNEPNSYPYEIWHYYKAGSRTNRRFVFYDPSLTSDFLLLNSDAQGELNDPKWQIRLHKRNYQPKSIDDENRHGGTGSRADELYKNPR